MVSLKRISETEKAQRFTPRRARSNWTELNKERARRLIRLGLMTDAGTRTLPDLSAKFEIASDILAAIKHDQEAWQFFSELPDLYIRVRIGYIEEVRKQPDEFHRRCKISFRRHTIERCLAIGMMANDCCNRLRSVTTHF